MEPLHLFPVLRQLLQCPTGSLAPARLLQSGQRGLQPEGALQLLLLKNRQPRKEPLNALNQEAGPPLLTARTLDWPGHHQLAAWLGTGEIDGGHLPVQQLLLGLVELQPVAGEQGPVLVRQQPRCRGHLGDAPVVRPQKKQYFHPVAGLTGGLPRRHPV